MYTRMKDYQCRQCEKTFSDNANLKIHLKTHTWENLIKAANVKEVSHKIPILKNIYEYILERNIFNAANEKMLSHMIPLLKTM